MEVTIKRLKTIEGHEGLAFTCEVYCDGKKIGLAHDDGNGGEVDFQLHPYTDANRKLVEQLEAELATRPKVDINIDKLFDGKPMMVQPDLQWAINSAVDTELRKKDAEKMERKKKQGILYGKNLSYCNLAYWNNMTLESMRLMPRGTDTVQAKINYIKDHLNAGETILNAEYLKSLGWKV
jgi:hypothetical protein